MEMVSLLREFRRRRALVGLAALAAILVGFGLSYRISLPPESRKHEVGIASSRILVDTPHSQVLDVAPKGSETLGARASLLANLILDGEIKDDIARRAGLRTTQLSTVTNGAARAEEASPSGASSNAQAYVLTSGLVNNPDGEPLPIIFIETEAPDATSAAKLAAAAVSSIRAYLEAKAASEKVADARRLQVTRLGAPEASVVTRGPRRLIAFGAAVFMFFCGCAAIIVGPTLRRSWRAASVHDEFGNFGGTVVAGPFFDDERLDQSAEIESRVPEWPERRRTSRLRARTSSEPGHDD